MLDQLIRLKESFKPCLPQGKAYDIVAYMVEATLKQLSENGSELVPFNRDNFVASCHACKDPSLVDASKWVPKAAALNAALSRLQNDLNAEQRIVLHEKVSHGRGNTNQYWLALAEPSSALHASPIDLDIRYNHSEKGEIRPAFLLRWFFSDGELRNRSRKGKVFIFGTLTLCVGWIVLFALSVLTMYVSKEPLTIGHITKLLVSGGAFYWVMRLFYEPWWQLLDDRVILAPDATTALSEDPCQLEMYRHGDEKWIRFVRFTADCPLCGAGILLAKGQPDQRLPLVGRCLESPHYHVFSFDRTSQAGTYIGPPLPAAQVSYSA